jgi:hypothetical protein
MSAFEDLVLFLCAVVAAAFVFVLELAGGLFGAVFGGGKPSSRRKAKKRRSQAGVLLSKTLTEIARNRKARAKSTGGGGSDKPRSPRPPRFGTSTSMGAPGPGGQFQPRTGAPDGIEDDLGTEMEPEPAETSPVDEPAGLDGIDTEMAAPAAK